MTTETDRARPRSLGRIDPALRDAAASLDIVEFRAESLPAERERADRLAAERAAGVDIEDRAVSGPGDERLGLRLYRGQTKTAAPLVVYAHGGGFVTGNLDTDHPHCVDLARAAGCLVVSVDYRLAPEHPCPAALDDMEAAFRYVVESSGRLDADGSRVVVMGRDAGAALVAAVAQRVFDQEGPPILAQVLHQPMLDSDATPSRREFQRTPGLNGPAVSRAWAHYLGHGAAKAHTYRPTGRTWRACRRRSSVAPRSTRAATKPSTTRTGCCTLTCTPNCTLSRRRFTGSIQRCRSGLSPGKAPRCTRRCFAGRLPSSDRRRCGPDTGPLWGHAPRGRYPHLPGGKSVNSDRVELGDQPGAVHLGQRHQHAARRHRR